MATVYEALKAAGCEIDHHESDLYVKETPESVQILRRFFTLDQLMLKLFVNEIDHTRWYDLSFKYDPFWRATS